MAMEQKYVPTSKYSHSQPLDFYIPILRAHNAVKMYIFMYETKCDFINVRCLIL